MVTPQSVTIEGQDGAVKESIVLSRIRMLDARLSGGDKTSPSAYTRKSVHPFNRTINNNFHVPKAQQEATNLPENRDSDPSDRLTQSSNRDKLISSASPPQESSRFNSTIKTDLNYLARFRNTSPIGERGSPLSRDDTAHDFESKNRTTEKTRYSASPLKPIRNVSPTITEKNRYSASPLKSIQNASPTKDRNINTRASPSHTDSKPPLNQHKQATLSIPLPTKPVAGESPVKTQHPLNKLQSMAENRQIRDVLVKSPDVLPAGNKTKIPARVASHFGRNSSSPKNSGDKLTTSNHSKDVNQNQNSTNRSPSPGESQINLKRHYWDSGKQSDVETDNQKDAANGQAQLTIKPTLDLSIGKSKNVNAKDPSPRNANQRQSKPEPEASISFNNTLHFQTKIQREYRRIPPSPKRRTLQSPSEKKESELERNLFAASAVMHEEKKSSVGSSSSSGRSGLSQEELGGIAAKALKLSQMKEMKRYDPTPLQQIISSKRYNTSNISQQESRGGTSGSATGSGSDVTLPYSYSSAQRLSERLTRAERFTALKKAHQAEQTTPLNPSSPLPNESCKHPVFGFPKNPIAVNTLLASDSAPTLSPEPSCVRRSKHLSKALQTKANQFASASPTRRAKTGSGGFGNSPKVQKETKVNAIQHQSQNIGQSQQQSRYDPLGLHVSNPSFQYESHFQYGHKEKQLNVSSQTGYKNGTRLDVPAHQSNPMPKVQNKFALKDDRYHQEIQQPILSNQNRSNANNRPNILTPGQKLEILAREQRSKFEEDQNKYKSFNQNNFHTNEEYDENTNYSHDGISSVDGDILYEDPVPVSIPRTTIDSRRKTNNIRDDHLTNDFNNPEIVRPVNNIFNNVRPTYQGQGRDVSRNDRVSTRPDPVPVAHEPLGSPATACDNTFTGDNTYTGSLNKPTEVTSNAPIVDKAFPASLIQDIALTTNDSSDSSAARPDAFHWLHQKYGNQVTNGPDYPTKMQANSKHITVGTKESTPNHESGIDEDDDVFFGLDEETSEEEAQQPERKGASETNRVTDDIYVNVPKKIEQLPHTVDKVLRKGTDTKQSQKQSNEKKIEKQILSEQMAESNEQNEEYSSAATDLEHKQKKGQRPTPVETESRPSISGTRSIEQEYTDGDDETEQDENKPPPSVLKNLGSVIVKSIQRACAIPEELPNINIASCALNTKMKCEEKMSEAWVGIHGDENVTHGDASRTSKTTDTGGALNENDIGAQSHENDDQSETSESSRNSQSNIPFGHLRETAQNKLRLHAETAMALFGNGNPTVYGDMNVEKFESKPTISTDSSTTHGPQPLPNDNTISPTSRISETVSIDHRMVLQTFSTCLKKGGVEVLKLSRWNIWQIRYLTVSKEMQKSHNSGNVADDAAQCPRALLWLKQSGSTLRNRSLSSINGAGQGGMFFECMKQVVAVESNEFYDRHLPRRLQKRFPEYAGVLLHYALNGIDRHVHFCFKTKQDAQSFITTMRIIQDVGKRETSTSKPEDDDEPIHSIPTVLSETKSNDS